MTQEDVRSIGIKMKKAGIRFLMDAEKDLRNQINLR